MASLGIVPIRYRSSRLPNKTFLDCAGKQLIQWTIDSIRKSNLNCFVVVSSCINVRWYCERQKIRVIKRPKGLESDKALVLDTVNWLNDDDMIRSFDVQMLLQITNPTRTHNDINRCLEYFDMQTINSVCSVTDVGEYHPNRMYKQTIGCTLEPLIENKQWTNTQQLEGLYLRDGSIYAWRTKEFLANHGQTLLPPRILGYGVEPYRSVRIDTARDLEIADRILTRETTPLH